MEPLPKQDQPRGWGEDEFSNFLEIAHRNGYATFANLRRPFRRIIDVDALYRELVADLTNTPEWFAAIFLLRTHSSFLGAGRLAVAGQLSETYALLRATLENALYGFKVAGRPELQEVWLRRHDDARSLRTVQEEFQIRPILRFLSLGNPQVGDVAKTLYERTIDYGGHPNERALTQSLRMQEKAGDVHFGLNYMTVATEMAFGACFKTLAQVGVCALDIWRMVFHHRFEIAGLTAKLENLKAGL